MPFVPTQLRRRPTDNGMARPRFNSDLFSLNFGLINGAAPLRKLRFVMIVMAWASGLVIDSTPFRVLE